MYLKTSDREDFGPVAKSRASASVRQAQFALDVSCRLHRSVDVRESVRWDVYWGNVIDIRYVGHLNINIHVKWDRWILYSQGSAVVCKGHSLTYLNGRQGQCVIM